MNSGTDLPSDIRKDIFGSIKVYLSEVSDDLTDAMTIDQLTEFFQGSGYETKREWVQAVTNDMCILGLCLVVGGKVVPNRGVRS